MADEIFVFGSNLAGRHGKGAALEARQKHGAEYGKGVGLTGRAYALPTKDERLRTLPLSDIARHIADFIVCAKSNPHLKFKITHVGCGLAGYNWVRDIRPLFPDELPSNCWFLTPTPSQETQ